MADSKDAEQVASTPPCACSAPVDDEIELTDDPCPKCGHCDDEIELTDDPCPKCGHCMVTRPCHAIDCDDGYYHDCGEDCCCCADPFPNVRCPECLGTANHVWCQNCGWDETHKCFLNGKPEAPLKEPNPKLRREGQGDES